MKITLVSTFSKHRITFPNTARASLWLRQERGCISGLLSRGITHIGEFEIIGGKNNE